MKNKIIKLVSLVMIGVIMLGNSVFAYEGLGEFQVNTYTNDAQSNRKISYCSFLFQAKTW